MDIRHLQTMVWMMIGLIQSGLISLMAWTPYVHGRARYCQSLIRRFRRWLDNERIDVHALYGPLIADAMAQWGEGTIYLALDTSMLWDKYCVIRISIIYRGRAIPLIWEVIEHASSQVSYESYKTLLNMAATLLPRNCRVVFLADRGFADTNLMKHLKKLEWHWRIRIKGSFWIYRKGFDRIKAGRIHLAPGQAFFWHGISVTGKCYGPVHMAIARRHDAKDSWIVLNDEPTDITTFKEYGLRFDIEENFLDDKSNGFQLESSLIRSIGSLTRLCFVLAMTTLYLVCQATLCTHLGPLAPASGGEG